MLGRARCAAGVSRRLERRGSKRVDSCSAAYPDHLPPPDSDHRQTTPGRCGFGCVGGSSHWPDLGRMFRKNLRVSGSYEQVPQECPRPDESGPRPVFTSTYSVPPLWIPLDEYPIARIQPTMSNIAAVPNKRTREEKSIRALSTRCPSCPRQRGRTFRNKSPLGNGRRRVLCYRNKERTGAVRECCRGHSQASAP